MVDVVVVALVVVVCFLVRECLAIGLLFGAADAVLLSPPVAITSVPISATQTTTTTAATIR